MTAIFILTAPLIACFQVMWAATVSRGITLVRTVSLSDYSNNHYTESSIAKCIVDHFSPRGKVLEPFRGNGAFYEHLPAGVQWCEISEGRNFLDHKEPMDWIVTNPPYEDLTEMMRHSFKIATHTVFLVPMSKIYSSAPRMDLVQKVAGVKEELIFGSGRSIGFNTGFVFAAMHFRRGYSGPLKRAYYSGKGRLA